MSSSISSPVTWANVRPWRNNNPGDLRTLPPFQGVWDGQIGSDNLPGGPFAIFSNRTMGWRALGVLLLTYYRDHGLRTVEAIIGRYAPALENDTNAYVGLVCSHLEVAGNAPIDVTNPAVLDLLCQAISLAEGGARIAWPVSERSLGVRMALGLAPDTASSGAEAGASVTAKSSLTVAGGVSHA